MVISTRTLAALLVKEAGDRVPYFLDIFGLKLAFEGHGFAHYMQAHHHPDLTVEQTIVEVWGDEMLDVYRAHLFALENLRPEWVAVLKEAADARAKVGLASALNVFDSCRFVLLNHEDALEAARAEGIDFWQGISMTLEESSAEEITKLFSLVLGNGVFSEYFIEVARMYTPTVSNVDYNRIAWVLKNYVPTAPVIIDLGCGDGSKTTLLPSYFREGVIKGYEIRNLGWERHRNSPVQFRVVSPFKLPDLSESVDAILLLGVIGHWTETAARKILFEVHHALKVGGVLVVGPQGASEVVYKRLKRGWVQVYPKS